MQSFVSSSNWLAVTLSSDAFITTLSSSAEQFTGYSAQELVGHPVTQILADSSVFEIPRILNAANEWGYWQGEIIHRSRGGKHLEARGTVSLLTGKGNRTAGYLLMSNLNKSLVLENCDGSAVLEVAANLRTFAHDLNNPLAVMMGLVQLLILNANCQGKIRADIEKLYSELKRVIQSVERMHNYAHSLYEKTHPDKKMDMPGRSA